MGKLREYKQEREDQQFGKLKDFNEDFAIQVFANTLLIFVHDL